MNAPLFILAPHRSFTSIACAMLGEHPRMYGLPEMNLVLTETLEEWWELFHHATHYEAHGTLRAVAQLYYGEQTPRSIRHARHWLRQRLHLTTGAVFRELAEKVHPRILVDKSPYYTARCEYLRRLHAAFPEARYLHLLRHPRSYGESLQKGLLEAGVAPSALEDILHRGGDFQKRWRVAHTRIHAFLAGLPEERWMQLQGERLLEEPDRYLREIVTWLGLGDDAETVERMKHPERSDYASFGPPGARLGNNPHFMEEPSLRQGPVRRPSLDGPLPWRSDGTEFSPEVKALARRYHYC